MCLFRLKWNQIYLDHHHEAAHSVLVLEVTSVAGRILSTVWTIFTEFALIPYL